MSNTKRVTLGRRPANEPRSDGELTRWRAQLDVAFPPPYGASWDIRTRILVGVYDGDSEECQLWMQRVRANLPQEWSED